MPVLNEPAAPRGGRILFANDLPYTDSPADVFAAIRDTFAFAANDWAGDRATAWLYGIIVGWDPDPDEHDPDDGDPGAALASVAAKHGWTSEQVETLRALHEQYTARTRVGQQAQTS